MSVPAYTISGREDATPVILAHGLATDRTMWDAVVERLGDRFQLIAYDARGHGETAGGPDGFSLSDLAADAIALMDNLKIAQAHFVGLSMGGMIGMGLGLDDPDRIRSLVVCDARADAPESYRAAWDARIQKVRDGGVETIVDPTLERWLTAEFREDQAAVARVRAMMLRTSAAGYVNCAAALKGLDHARRLPEMTVPTLYLVGSDDQGAPPEVMHTMHRATPDSRFVEVPKAGHISAVEQPDAVAAAIRSFLEDREE